MCQINIAIISINLTSLKIFMIGDIFHQNKCHKLKKQEEQFIMAVIKEKVGDGSSRVFRLKNTPIRTISSYNYSTQKPELVKLACPNRHPLYYDTRTDGKYSNVWFCDVCRYNNPSKKQTNIPSSQAAYRCFKCNFDACVSCVRTPKISLFCPKEHLLSFLSDKQNRFCDICKAQTNQQKLSREPRYNCSICFFDICQECAKNRNTFYCPKRHILKDLNQSNHNTICKLCYRSGVVKYCYDCDFGLCDSCHQNYHMPEYIKFSKQLNYLTPVKDKNEKCTQCQSKSLQQTYFQTMTSYQKYCGNCYQDKQRIA